MPLIHHDLEHVAVVTCAAGHTGVLACRPVRRVHGRLEPFPTSHWLACPDLDVKVADLERRGFIARLEADVVADATLREELAADHAACARERELALTDDERRELTALGLTAELARRGIGGVRDFATVKCLHAHVAWHLARENGGAIGRRLARDGLLPCCGVRDR